MKLLAALGLVAAVLCAGHGNSLYQAGDVAGAAVMLIPVTLSVLPAALMIGRQDN